MTATRNLSAAAGLACLFVVALLPEGPLSDRVAFSSLLTLGLSAALTVLILGRYHALDKSIPRRMDRRRATAWGTATIALSVISGIAIQSWFQAGTAIGTGDTTLPAGVALAALPALVASGASGRLPIRWSAILLALVAAPFLGYVFSNPPLVGMIFIATVATPLLILWLDGKSAAMRGVWTLCFATPLFLALSAYWIVPAVVHLTGFQHDQLASVTSWNWTEGRATIRNAFWLNTAWGWSHPDAYPFASLYETFPLSLLKFLLPLSAFAVLASPLMQIGNGAKPQRVQRLAVALALVAISLIFLSTGTNLPGSVVFDPLYNLPYGWLLREPGRFLMVVALAYSLMVAVSVELIFDYGRLNSLVMSLQRRRGRRIVSPGLRLVTVLGAAVAISLPAFPLFTGAEVPDSRPGLPSAHVRIPAYWPEMANFVDALAGQGGIVVMPPDDFYGMGYTWGYYGADNFVSDLFERPVLLGNVPGYYPVVPQILDADQLIAQSILSAQWRQAEDLIAAFNTPFVLVRGDIDTTLPGRSIISPGSLAQALSTAPNFSLVQRIGPLELFELIPTTSNTESVRDFMTINTDRPDLRLLPLLPPRAALVTAEPQAGVPYIVQAPPLESWSLEGNSLEWRPAVPMDLTYRVADVVSQSVVNVDHPGASNLGKSGVRVTYDPLQSQPVTVSLTGRTALSSRDPAGLSAQVGDCAAFDPQAASRGLRATVIPGGGPNGIPALELSATDDAACVAQPVKWHGGPLLLNLMIHHVEGAAPRICLWETGPNHCASIPSLPGGDNWSRYRTAIVPDSGTTALGLFLYAMVDRPGTLTVIRYADAQMLEVPELAAVDIVVDTQLLVSPAVGLVVAHNTFSQHWRASVATRHVLVDGMLNGWLTSPSTRIVTAEYSPTPIFWGGVWTSAVVALCLALYLVVVLVRWAANRAGIRPGPRKPPVSGSVKPTFRPRQGDPTRSTRPF